MPHKYKTDLLLNIAGVEHEFPATIVYVRRPGSSETRIQPAEPASCEIIDVMIHGTTDRPRGDKLPWIIVDKLADDEELLAKLMEDWYDSESDAAELAAEARAEMAREDRGN
jgi:hypothetical protein